MFLFLAITKNASADALKAFLEWDYSSASFKTTDKSGLTTKSTFDTFGQKYNLYFDKTLFPYLRVDGGGLFTRDLSTSDTDGAKSGSSDNNSTYFFDAILKTPVFTAAGGYNKKEERQTFTKASPVSIFNESYTGTFSWRPADLPGIDLNYTKSDSYDGRRLVRDDTSDQVVLSARYDPFKQLQLRYSGTFNSLTDRITGVDTTLTTQTGKISYSDSFFNKRLSVASDYTVTSRDTAISGNMSATVESQAFPVAGLSATAGLAPADLLTGALSDSPFLIDGVLTGQNVINIGLAPTQAGDTKFRSMGLDFFNPTEVSELLVWVDPDISKIVNPGNISLADSGLFVWRVFTSSDNMTWTEVPGGVASEFGPFLSRFKLTFAKVTARYVMVSVQPLPLAAIGMGFQQAQIANIFVTELQAFTTKTAKEAAATSAGVITQLLNLNARARVLDRPDIYYEFSLFLNHADPSSSTTAFMSNGLSLNHKLGDKLTATARVAREDNFMANGKSVSYLYTAALTAKPFPTLNDSLIYSGRSTTEDGKSTSSNSIFLYNNAELYKGINALLSGGVSLASLDTGQSTTTTSLNAGLTLVPHRTVNINVNYNLSDSSQSGGGRPSTSTMSGRTVAGVAYTPFRALYLFASLEVLQDNVSTRTSENYGLNFSPFPDGELQFNFTYNENLRPAAEGRTRLISPSLRWNVVRNAYLEASYVFQQTSASQQNSEAHIFNASLHINL